MKFLFRTSTVQPLKFGNGKVVASHILLGILLESPAFWLFAQSFVQAQVKENIKATRHWPFKGNPPVTDGFPHILPVTRKMFPFDDVIMTKACVNSMVLLYLPLLAMLRW